MRIFLPAFFLLLFAGACNTERTQVNPAVNTTVTGLRIKGSETMMPLMMNVINAFSAKLPQPQLQYDATGSNAAIMAFQRNEADLVALSQLPSNEEMELLQENGEVEIVTVGYDGLNIIVNRSNKTDRLTLTQLRDIYTGRITSWSELGGEHMPIKAYSRDASSGTFDFFRNHVLDSLNYRPDDVNCASNEAVIAGVKEDPQGIGYVGMAFNLSEVKPVELSKDDGKTWFSNHKQNIRSQDYPLTRPLYVAYYKKNKQNVSAFVDFILSSEGQVLVEESGFIPALIPYE